MTEALASGELTAAFADTPVDSARVFRASIDALSRPGTVQTIAAALTPPRPLGLATAALLLTLCDVDTPLHLGGSVANDEAIRWLKFHTGVVLVDDPAEAGFVVVGGAPDDAILARLAIGSEDYPDQSATLIVELQSLANGQVPGALELSGPGIETTAHLFAAPLPAGFAAALARNHLLYPLGFDTFLTAGASLVGLPRSTRITLIGGR